MKYLRKAIRKIKYNLRFINKSEKTKLNYVVNSSSNTKLTELMNLYGSDKGGKNNHHNYSDFYSEIFFHKRKEIKTLLEIGIGTNNTNLDSNMGNEGVPSASLRAWRDYFENQSYNFSIVDIYHKKNIANNCLIIIKNDN